MHPFLQRAVLELGIDVPIYRVEETPEGLRLYVYGGRVLRWVPSPPPSPPLPAAWERGRGGGPLPSGEGPSPPRPGCRERGPGGEGPSPPRPVCGERGPGGEGLTVIPGIGKRLAQALQSAGLPTVQHLAAATDATLLAVPGVNKYVLAKIRDYCYTHNV